MVYFQNIQARGFRVSGFGSRGSALGFRVSGLGFRVSDFGFRISGFGVRQNTVKAFLSVSRHIVPGRSSPDFVDFVDFINFVDFDSIGRIVGVSPCHPHARTGVAVLIQTYKAGSCFRLIDAP